VLPLFSLRELSRCATLASVSITSTLGFSALSFVLALSISSPGFYRVVYFISTGYAFSISAMAIACALLFRGTLSWPVWLQLALLLLYGLRLGTYLIRREFSPQFARELEEAHRRADKVPAKVRPMIWLSVSVLYVLMFAPAAFNAQLAASSPNVVVVMAGVAIMAGGLLLESLADAQKAKYKRDNPKRFCDVGLYRFVRCPNYLGEITFWLGNLVAGMSAYAGPWRWLASIVGFVCITLIMMGSTKRLEAKQRERYGAREDYQEYIRSVPVLFPFVRVYSLENVKVYLE
jgi:steroid 5-alpha reductase family enzyme